MAELQEMPMKYYGMFFNACTDPCDMVEGPCTCGAWHHMKDWPDEVQQKAKAEMNERELVKRRETI